LSISIVSQVVVVDAEAYTYDDEVIKKADAMGKSGLVEISAMEDSFIFTVETTGAITAYELIMNAITVLKQKLDAVHLQDDDGDFGELGAHLGGSWGPWCEGGYLTSTSSIHKRLYF
jgi:DNA-directed RNA polymerase II subunit RPB3